MAEAATAAAQFSRSQAVAMTVSDGAAPWSPALSSRSSAPGASRTVLPRGPFEARLPFIRLHGVILHAITEEQCISYIMRELAAGRGGTGLTPNLDHLRRCRNDLSFGALMAEADIVVADGMPLIWASRLQGTPLPERIAGSDLISSLSAAAARDGRSVFLLGGAPGTADRAATVLRQRHPKLRIVGTHCPRYGFEDDPGQMRAIIDVLATTRPDLIYVALGSPKQERLILRIRPVAPDAWWLGLGNSFSFLCGDVTRAPQWLQRAGLEWLHRLCQEPRRLFKRYIIHGIPFAAGVMGEALLRGLGRKLHLLKPDVATIPAAPLLTAHSLLRGSGVPRALHGGDDGFAGADSPSASSPGGADRDAPAQSVAIADDRRPVSPAAATATTATDRLRQLRALVLLGGSVRPTPLNTSIGRSVLDLPVDGDRTILTRWLDHAAEMARQLERPELPVRVLVSRGAADPVSANGFGYRTVSIERDAAAFRGTGGVLHDLAREYDDEDLILVANASQVLLEPLWSIAGALDQAGGQLALIAHPDGTPSGLMLISCAALRLIPNSGFVDMKEQALPQIASRYSVSVVQRRRLSGLPVRSPGEYIQALRQDHCRRAGRPASEDLWAEEWRPAFAIVEAGARVDPAARIHDAVVLGGARVEAGAVVVRCVVCPEARMKADQTAVDRLVTAESLPRRTSA